MSQSKKLNTSAAPNGIAMKIRNSSAAGLISR